MPGITAADRGKRAIRERAICVPGINALGYGKGNKTEKLFFDQSQMFSYNEL